VAVLAVDFFVICILLVIVVEVVSIAGIIAFC